MPETERGGRKPASARSAAENLDILQEEGRVPFSAYSTTAKLRQELEDEGLKGFKRGGKVKKTGVAKVHKGERVLTKKQAAKPAVKKALRKPVARRRR